MSTEEKKHKNYQARVEKEKQYRRDNKIIAGTLLVVGAVASAIKFIPKLWDRRGRSRA